MAAGQLRREVRGGQGILPFLSHLGVFLRALTLACRGVELPLCEVPRKVWENPERVSRALIKQAIEDRDWDLLDETLERDNSHVNDADLYTDDWGEWWAPLYECCLGNQLDGVRVLLKHGAKRKQRAWGDGMCRSPLEVAEEKGYQEIAKLLRSKGRPSYQRKKRAYEDP